MLPTVREEIERAAGQAGVRLTEVSHAHAGRIRRELLSKYGKDYRFEFGCDNITAHAAIQHPEAWTWIGEFLGRRNALFFYDSSLATGRRPDNSMFLVPHGEDLVRLLEDCYGFVFYVTDEDTSYVLCFNEHDYLIGAGSAREWVSSLAPRHEAWAASLQK